jgi:hypothetical protein
MGKELEHFGVLGMHWGIRRSSGDSSSPKRRSRIALIDVTPQVNSFLEKHRKKSVSQLEADTKKPAFGERLAKAYSLEIKNGKVKSIGLDTIPKIMATAFVAHLAISTVSDLGRIGSDALRKGKVPRWVGDIAWTTGKVISNQPLR